MLLSGRRWIAILLSSLITMAGCESQYKCLADFAVQAALQQARQNEHIAEQSQAVALQGQELAKASHDLVEKDAVARRELLHAQEHLQTQLHAERKSLDDQRANFYDERKAAVTAAHREPLLAQAMVVTGFTLAALLPLLVTAFALSRLPQSASEDLLIAEFFDGSNLSGFSTDHDPSAALSTTSSGLLNGLVGQTGSVGDESA